MATQEGVLRRIWRLVNGLGLFVFYSVMFLSGFIFVLVVALIGGAGLMSLLWALAGGVGFAITAHFTDNSLIDDVDSGPSNDDGLFDLFDD